ncbi:MAG TPA: PQQ-binding-like beta-propeller repeat protein [Acidobacteriota bacterium]|nr:PQQ-binding-like beta-propeller repeat protein [Acidobacteriota bacterium]
MKKQILLVTLLLTLTAITFAADWPQWRGLNRDGISKETGLAQGWPKTGPTVVWRVPIGEGYSAVSIAAGRLYTMDAKDPDEFVVCLNQADGKVLWRIRIDEMFNNDQGNGPRSTPTVDGKVVYALSANGTLAALNAANGNRIWSHNLRSEFDSRIPTWGTATSPLVEGNLLLVDVGGKAGHALIAFNKQDGSIAWKTHSDLQGYASPIAVTIGGVRQILFFTGRALVSVSPQGKVYSKYDWSTDYNANIATPILVPPDKIFISTNYGTGAALVRVIISGGNPAFQQIWKSKVMENHFNSSVLYQGNLYGFDNAVLKCIDAGTGAEKWKKSGLGKGSLILAGNTLIVLGDRGQLALVDATPAEYKEKAFYQAMQAKTWTMPSLAHGKLYLRSQRELISIDLTAPKTASIP